MPHASKHFYQFLGIHSFLVGLFPFFIPVFLWKQGFTLAHISLFIALTGIGFVVSLWIWDRIHKRISFQHIMVISFLLEMSLMAWVFMSQSSLFLAIFALLNGAYNCFFWITQRALFFETISTENSGEKFGNFQIFVALILKLGIFSGGLLLEYYGYLSVFIFSLLVGILGIISFLLAKRTPTLPQSLIEDKPLSLKAIFSFKDQHGSRPVFVIDGLFLFLESYFWVISLFLLAHESFWKLGILVILLAVSFGALFFFIKNSIDKIAKQLIYIVAVVAYALSWILRALVDEGQSLAVLLILLVLITFGTSFFRLAFNKRFFDLAKQTSAHQYLFLKSYYSQLFITFSFSVIGVLAFTVTDTQFLLKTLYFTAAFIAAMFLFYRPHSTPN